MQPFDQPVIALREKILELHDMAETQGLDFKEELQLLEERLHRLELDIYGNMKAWNRVQLARHPERPTTLDYIESICEDFIELHGDRHGYDDAAIVGGIGTLNGRPVTIIGHQRGKDTKENIRRNFGMPHPEGYRKALRLMQQAEKFNRPIITFIDTKGAYPGRAAEERGQSEAIAKNLFEMAGMTVPIISIVIGEGGSGGALGIGVCDQLLMLENSTYSVISPEGAAALLWKDASLAEKAAESMKITAPDLLRLGIADAIIPEVVGGAHLDVSLQADKLKTVLVQKLESLVHLTKEELIDQRTEKYHQIGT
ncbi:acetyl-CoA carboxylase subunit alpha [Exiguobacterium sp. Leaf187]|uniref:Acetyl-coenzyme A carboxylase carboxyl transferase subunit alpha n=2 Tax=Exiguobacterium TaxID=33986 RepID=A0A0V8GJ97_9BACL|nr:MULTISPECIES: acetyl-CoA carboxylase carboxyl transferase subunit alpha [Exiguobacterium]AHA30426.1 acetyl-CoA carboxylase subunit alpha [Exiguobacterium sp. MH3]AOT01390.1 acetyl-CoA carboxylase carboxyltransferase subunit alpha [Exiguobacterium sp. U13-1]KNH36664.1 acetyl-CoA carboxylase subunit alpha [Exiguobacterium acetylicum]KQS19657.1 acetyl-CoA carboxylase subunit alpha [Exiguobacterium sp. Leaf187]KSU50332.1 acetyl-CoA carboxylase subunit alpha [Exiguobacterium enclense]